MSIALRVAAVALWGGFMIGMANWSNTDAALIAAGLGTLLLGVLVGRWWVVLVALVPGALLAVATLVSDPDDFYEGSPGAWAALVALVTIAIAALLAVGVAITRSVVRLRHGLPVLGASRRWETFPQRTPPSKGKGPQ